MDIFTLMIQFLQSLMMCIQNTNIYQCTPRVQICNGKLHHVMKLHHNENKHHDLF